MTEDTHARLRIYSKAKGAAMPVIYDFGTVTSFEDEFSKSVNLVPVPSLPTICSFALEGGSSLVYSVSFARSQPEDVVNSAHDSTKWDNAHWSDRVMSLADRWQIRQGGYLMSFIPEGGADNPYLPVIEDEPVFVRSLVLENDESANGVVFGSIVLKVANNLGRGIRSAGTSGPTPRMVPAPGASDPVKVVKKASDGWTVSDAWGAGRLSVPSAEETGTVYVSLITSDDDLSGEYPLTFGVDASSGDAEDWNASYGISVITGLTVEAGPEQPFALLTLKLSRKMLKRVYEELDQANTIRADASMVSLKGIGFDGTYVVTSMNMSSTETTITAYADKETVRGMLYSAAYSKTTMTPEAHILKAVSEAGISAVYTNVPGIWRCAAGTGYTPSEMQVAFSQVQSKVSVWQVLQLCSLAIGARPFFLDDSLYIIDYTRIGDLKGALLGKGSGSSWKAVMHFQDPDDDTVSARCIDDVTIRHPDLVTNTVVIKGNSGTVTVRDDASVSANGERSTTIDLGSIVVPHSDGGAETAYTRFDKAVAGTILAYRKSKGEEVSFRVFELEAATDGEGEAGSSTSYIGWRPMFPPVCATGRFEALDDGEVFDTGGLYQNLSLTKFVRRYPEFNTTYTFGSHNTQSLAQFGAEIGRDG